MRISDWSSDMCSSDLGQQALAGDSLDVPVIGPATAAKDLYLGMASTQCPIAQREVAGVAGIQRGHRVEFGMAAARCIRPDAPDARHPIRLLIQRRREMRRMCAVDHVIGGIRSEEHTSELQSLMRISYT